MVFKTTLKEGRGEDRYLCSSLRGLIKNNRKIQYGCVFNLSQVVLSEVVAISSPIISGDAVLSEDGRTVA